MINGGGETTAQARSVDAVVRAFTDAELALREVTGAVERLRSAADQLDAARGDQLAVRESMAETVSAFHQLGRKIEDTTASLDGMVEVLRALDPERLWTHLDEHTTAIAAAADRASAEWAQASEDARARIEMAQTRTAELISRTDAELSRRADAIDAQGRTTRSVLVAVLALVAFNVVIGVLALVGWTPIT